jgi:colicin import membrane protein
MPMLAVRRRLSRSACSETPNGRLHEAAREDEDEREDDERIRVRGPPREVEREARERRPGDRERPHRDALQAVGAAGEPVELVGELVEDRGDAERHHQPRQVAAAQDEGARREAEQRARRDRDDEADERVGHHVLREQRRGVGAEAEERGVAERDDAGVAEDEVERDREQGDDRDLVEQQRLAGQQQPRQRQRGEERDLPPAPARCTCERERCRRRRPRARRRDGCCGGVGGRTHRAATRPNSPCGRQSRIAIITV